MFKINKKIIFSSIFIVILGLVSLAINKVNAQQQGFNIEVSPGKVNLEVDPGSEYLQKFRIGNFSGNDRTLYIYVQDFTVINEEGTPTFFENTNSMSEDARRFSLSQWVELPTDKLLVENNTTVEVEAKIKIPENAEAGSHFGAFFVQTESPEQTGVSAIGSVGRIASLMLVFVPGDVNESIKISEAYTDKNVYWGSNPEIEFVTLLVNEGNVHGIPVGAFSISGGYGAKTKSVIYNPNQGAVLPGAPERKLSQKFTLTNDSGIVPPIGKFTLDLVARYGTTNLPLETTIYFWMLPAKFLAAVAIITVVAIFVIWRALVSFRK